MRAFLALELSEDIRGALASLIGRFQRHRFRASWVPAGNLHLTLRFLGDLDDAVLGRLGETLAREYESVAPFTLWVGGVGCFPNPKRPRVLWAGVPDAPAGLNEVQRAAEMTARNAGLKAERKPFRPHITLARCRDRIAESSLLGALEEESKFVGGEFPVRSVSLFSSTLAPRGAVHRKQREFTFRWTGRSTIS